MAGVSIRWSGVGDCESVSRLSPQHTVTHCNTLQHTAIHCNTPHHTVTRCNTLQHTQVRLSLVCFVCLSLFICFRFFTHVYVSYVLVSLPTCTFFWICWHIAAHFAQYSHSGQMRLRTTLQHTATHRHTPQHPAAHCSTLKHTATHRGTLQDTAAHSNALQHTATRCNTLQQTVAHYNTLPHTATHESETMSRLSC